MIKKINIFNYEAYYLDYLEGNISEADAAVLLDFLDSHPDLKMEDEELPTFKEDEVSLGSLDFLKQTYDADPITDKNVEHFLISKHEAILSKEKAEELEKFIATNSAAAKNDRLFGAVYFTPDEKVVMAGKADLKKKAPVVLWPYYSGIAAAMIAAFFFLYNPAPSVNVKPVQYAQNDTANGTVSNQNKAASQPEVQEANFLSPITNLFTTSEPSTSTTVVEKGQQKQNSAEEQIILNNQPSRPMVAALDDKEISPISTIYTNPVETSKGNRDVAYTKVNDMQNPIEPITKFISEKTNREIDFRQPKSKKKKGFFVKIGKFELERK
jgi:hypothetical protein